MFLFHLQYTLAVLSQMLNSYVYVTAYLLVSPQAYHFHLNCYVHHLACPAYLNRRFHCLAYWHCCYYCYQTGYSYQNCHCSYLNLHFHLFPVSFPVSESWLLIFLPSLHWM